MQESEKKSESMRAVRVGRFGIYDELRVEEVPRPHTRRWAPGTVSARSRWWWTEPARPTASAPSSTDNPN